MPAARGTGDRGVTRATRLLVTAQIAAALVLVVGAALFARSLDRLSRADLGIESNGLVALDFDIEPAEAAGQPPGFLADEALRQTRALPGVVAAAMANRAPVDSSTPPTTVAGEDAPTAQSTSPSTPSPPAISRPSACRSSPDVPSAMDDGDGVAIVNETLARRLWPEGDALGRTLASCRKAGWCRWSASHVTPGTAPSPTGASARLPADRAGLRPSPCSSEPRRDPRRMLLAVQDVLDDVGPGVAGFFPRTHDDHLAIQLLPTRVASLVAAWLGGLGDVPCAAGLYGLMTWLVRCGRPRWPFDWRSAPLAATWSGWCCARPLRRPDPASSEGCCSLPAARCGARPAVRTRAVDAVAVLGGVAALLVVVAGASWWPARRAGRTDPASALIDLDVRANLVIW